MRFELKPFQETAREEILEELRLARQEVLTRNKQQAIILSSPTGSGKTITMAAVIEAVFDGHPGLFPPNPEATFLWFSDSPELNEQSREKLFAASDSLLMQRLVMIDTDFDQAVLDPGTVYFLNMQKLARTGRLVRAGDERRYTIWETLTNTIEQKPENFFLVIDEAHRGMHMSQAILDEAETIVQRFIVGNSKLPAVPLILGMSATPDRFDEVIGRTSRIRRPITIDPEEVRESGLLKDRIILFHPENSQPSDLTLLKEAVESWQGFRRRWDEFCQKKENSQRVEPMLVLQVEDGTKTKLTRTDLDRVIGGLQDAYPNLESRNIAHCFDEDRTLEVRGFQIRKAEASQLQKQTDIQVVLFKRALSTGWDCPRAEVMMSFRPTKDHTLIAQLVGRMVRSPLARRVEADERLNSVDLFLPYYDREGLREIVSYLADPDPESQMPVEPEIGGEGREYARADDMDVCFQAIEGLPSYQIRRTRKQMEAKRLLRLGFLLSVRDGLDHGAQEEAEATLLATLRELRDSLLEDEDFVEKIQQAGEIKVRQVDYDVGATDLGEATSITVPVTPENIEDLFEQVGRSLAPGEGLHKKFWKEEYSDDDPLRAKIELICVAQNDSSEVELERVAARTFQDMWDRNKAAIAALPEGKRETYRQLQGVAGAPKSFPIRLPDRIHVQTGEQSFPKHLYQDEDGHFSFPMNRWEEVVLDGFMDAEAVVGWLRNQDRKPWALCVSYEDRGQDRGFYPDFLVLRRVDEDVVVDVLEPHDMSRDTSWKKVKGLAQYADQHGLEFGRILMGVIREDRFRALNLNDRKIRERVKRIASNDEIKTLIVEQGTNW